MARGRIEDRAVGRQRIVDGLPEMPGLRRNRVRQISGRRASIRLVRDPRGSRLYREVGAIPFAYANEQLETWDPANPRRAYSRNVGPVDLPRPARE